MALIKMSKNNYTTIKDVGNVIQYVLDPDKRYSNIWGSNLLYLYPDVNMTAKTILDFNLYYGKTQGSVVKHMIISYEYLDGNIETSPVLYAFYQMLNLHLCGYPFVYALHEDTCHPHFHIVFGSVNLYTGLKYKDTNATLFDIAETLSHYTKYKNADGKEYHMKYKVINDRIV